jgi:protein-tyrosine-phosphatase
MAPRFVLFVCTHNAGRSQMAAAFLSQLGGPAFAVDSAGTAPAEALNPAVVAAMLEVGIDLRDNEPTLLTREALDEADLVITLGVDSADLPGAHYLDWNFPDPAGSRLETVRPIRDAIRARVLELIGELNSPAAA